MTGVDVAIKVLLKKTKKGVRVYFDNKRLMTNNSFQDTKEAREWLKDHSILRREDIIACSKNKCRRIKPK